MTRGDDEEGGEVHQRFEDDAIWMRGEERVVCQQRPSRRVVLGVGTQNRFSTLQDTQLEGSGPEEVAMTECSDTESCESAGRPSRRLRLVWNESEAGPEVRNAATLIGVLATRVGAIPHGNVLPGAIRRQRWSALNVPLIWGAASHAESCPVFDWLISVTSAVNEPVHFYGGERQQAVRSGLVGMPSGKLCVPGVRIPKLNCRIGSGGTGFQLHNLVITSLPGHKNTFSRQGAGSTQKWACWN